MDNRLVDGLNFARGPANHDFFNVGIPPQAEMQPPVILRGETAATGDLLHLLLTIPKQRHLGADRAAVTAAVIRTGSF